MKNVTILSITLLLSAYIPTQTKGVIDTYLHKEAAGTAATNAKEHAKAACKDIGSCLQHSAHVAKNVAVDAAEEVADKVSTIGKKAKTTTKKMANAVADKTQEVAHDAQGHAESFGRKAGKFVDKAAHTVADTAHLAKDKIVEVGTKLADTTNRATVRIIKADAEATEKIALKTADAAHSLAERAKDVEAQAHLTARKAQRTYKRIS